MPFAVLIFVCAAATAPADCNRETAIDVIKGPDAPNEIMCARDGQAYVAEIGIVREGEYPKITCSRTAIGKTVG